MAPKSGQAENEEEIKEGKVVEIREGKIHKVPWRLKGGNVFFKEKRVGAELIFPSASKGRKGTWIHPHVMLDVYPQNDDTIHALTIMRDCTSTNILHASLVLKGVSDNILAWVEPFTGNLEDHFKSNRLGIFASKDANAKIVLPTPSMGSAVNQIVDGLKDLHRSGQCHGNFSLANTRYVLNKNSGALAVKLCNFKRKKAISYKTKLAEDWHAVAKGLEQICESAKKLKYRNLDWCQVDGLIKVMKDIAPCNIDKAFELIKQQPFFWEREQRKLFFTHDIALALKTKKDFIVKVKNAEFITLPWNEIDLNGLLSIMNRYRSKEQKEAYNVNCRVSFVNFVSGAYTREHELKPVKKVDRIIKESCPDLYYRLYELLPHAN